MKFHWNNGCLPRDEWLRVVDTIDTISNSIMIPSLGGFVENGTDYCVVDFIVEIASIRHAVAILHDFANTL